MYINTQNQQVVSEQEIKLANPNTSFSIPFNPPTEYKWIFPSPQPTVTLLQFVREIAPVLTVKGHYEQQWEIVDKYATYTDAEGVIHTKAELEAAAIALDTLTKYKSSVPKTVTMRQARLALYSASLLAQVTSAVAAATPDVQIEWEYATEIKRDWPTLITLASYIGLTEAQLDQLFITAGGL